MLSNGAHGIVAENVFKETEQCICVDPGKSKEKKEMSTKKRANKENLMNDGPVSQPSACATAPTGSPTFVHPCECTATSNMLGGASQIVSMIRVKCNGKQKNTHRDFRQGLCARGD